MKKERISENFRKTSETEIFCKLNIDGKGLSNINTPIPFMNHMLEQISKHSYIDLVVECSGDVEIDARYLAALPAELSVYRIERGATEDRPLLQSLGLSNSASGNWQTVDVLFSPAVSEGFDVGDLNITLSDKTIPVGIVSVGDGEYLIEEVPAMGGILRLKHKGNEIGAITLPQRERIKVAFENGTPEVLKQLVLLDPACIEAADGADLVVGTSEDADLRLVKGTV